jgi:hypothetical protein
VLVVGEVDNVYKLHKFILEFYHPDRSIEARRVNLVIAGQAVLRSSLHKPVVPFSHSFTRRTRVGRMHHQGDDGLS